jgi:hypothetical protein
MNREPMRRFVSAARRLADLKASTSSAAIGTATLTDDQRRLEDDVTGVGLGAAAYAVDQ